MKNEVEILVTDTTGRFAKGDKGTVISIEDDGCKYRFLIAVERTKLNLFFRDEEVRVLK